MTLDHFFRVLNSKVVHRVSIDNQTQVIKLISLASMIKYINAGVINTRLSNLMYAIGTKTIGLSLYFQSIATGKLIELSQLKWTNDSFLTCDCQISITLLIILTQVDVCIDCMG